MISKILKDLVKKPKLRFFKRVIKYSLFSLLGLSLLILIFYFWIQGSIPDTEELQNYKLPTSTLIVDLHNVYIGELYKQKRYWVKYESIPELLIKAFIAAEDAKFFSHHGFDFNAIQRAFIVNIKHGRFAQGGSTLTQQLAKNLLHHKKTLLRKVKEAILAYRIEKTFSKEKILEWYLNTIYFGRGLYGIKAACEGYFDKPLEELTLSEIGFLVALAKAPSFYSTNLDHPSFLERREYVINRLFNEHSITQEEFDSVDLKAINIIQRPKGRFLPIIHKQLIALIQREYRIYKEFDHSRMEDAEIETNINIKIIRRIQELVSQKIFQTIEGTKFKHAILAVDINTSGIISFNTNYPWKPNEPFLDKVAYNNIVYEYMKMIFLIQNIGNTRSILFQKGRAGFEFVHKVLSFQKVNNILSSFVNLLNTQLNPITPTKLSAFLGNRLSWNYKRTTKPSLLSILVDYTEMFQGFYNKRSQAISAIQNISNSSNNQIDQKKSFKIPLQNQINLGQTYFNLLKEFLEFNSVTLLSNLKGNFTKYIPGIFLFPNLLKNNTSLLVYRDNVILSILSFPITPIEIEDNSKVSATLLLNQIKLLDEINIILKEHNN